MKALVNTDRNSFLITVHVLEINANDSIFCLIAEEEYYLKKLIPITKCLGTKEFHKCRHFDPESIA